MAQADDIQEYCESFSKLASVIMEGRQIGVSSSEIIEVSDGDEVVARLKKMAFDVPRYNTEEFQQREIEEF